MKNTKNLKVNTPISYFAALCDNSYQYVKPADIDLFNRLLKDFLPSDIFDIHAHFYDARVLAPEAFSNSFAGSTEIGYEAYLKLQSAWMADLCPNEGLFFPYPVNKKDVDSANQLMLKELKKHPSCRSLLMIRPEDAPSHIEQVIKKHNLSGFKVYHNLADRKDTFNAEVGEYLPLWAWEIANKSGLCIMLHLVKSRALSDINNQQYIRDYCQKYPNAKLILAHAARGFCSRHTIEGIHSIKDLDNVFFDTSAICESETLEVILKTFGTTRLMYGSDFPESEVHCRPFSVGDGFYWTYENSVNWNDWQHGQLTLCGIESLLAVKQACQNMHLTESDVERIFCTNARQLLGISTKGSGELGQETYQKAKSLIPGATQLFGKRAELFAPNQWPPYYTEARGCEVIDLDGRHFIDFTTTGIGTCLLGYANPQVTTAVMRSVQLGSMSSLNCPQEVELAELLIKMHPWANNVRLARCGGEALAIAARIVRAATERDVIAFCGYHGWSDWYLAANLSDDKALDGHLLPGLSPMGVPRGLKGTAIPFNYNKIDELAHIIKNQGRQLAAVIMEPTRTIEPAKGFLEQVRELCDSCGARLVFDEVTTGFRLYKGGVHLKYGIEPDIAVFAKALGNGHPIAAIIGKTETMQAAQDTFISSTYWTEGVGPAAGLATLKVMESVDIPQHVNFIGDQLRKGCTPLTKAHNLPLKFNGHNALTYISFEHPDKEALMTLFTTRMLKHGFLASSTFYPSLAHKEHHVQAFLAAAEKVFAEIADSIKKKDTYDRIGGQVKLKGFGRLA